MESKYSNGRRARTIGWLGKRRLKVENETVIKVYIIFVIRRYIDLYFTTGGVAAFASNSAI